MTLKPVEQTKPEDLRADVCVIGSGPSGQAVAAALRESAVDVLVVDAGDIEADRWGRRLVSTAMPSRGRQYPNAGHQISVRVGGTSDRWAIALDEASQRQTGVRLCRLDEIDLLPRPTTGADGWPITIEELDPFYRSAEAMFGLGPDCEYAATSAVDDARLTTEAVWVADGSPVADPDLTDTRVVSRCAIRTLTVDHSGRITEAVGGTRDGTTVRIEADVFVIAMGAVQSTRILLDSPWAEAESVANSSGLVGRYLADHPQLVLGQLVVDRGADLSTIRSLAPSVRPEDTVHWPNLVTSATRSLDPDIARLATTLVPTDRIPRTQPLRNRFPRPTGARTGGPNAAALIIDALRDRHFDHEILRGLPALIGGLDEIGREFLQEHRPQPGWSVEELHWAHLIEQGDIAGFQLLAVAEQMPNPDNRIVLSEQHNAVGARRPRIEWRWSDDDVRRAEKAAEDVRAAIGALGVGRVIPRRGRASVHKLNSHHPSGTVRMSDSPADGVVDPDLRCHDHPNLYVVGSAVFNTSGCITPTLTAAALGFRLGRHLADGGAGVSAPGRPCDADA